VSIQRNTLVAIGLAIAGWTLYVTTRPDDVMLSYMYDDAFYYLVPAYAFAHGHGWTLDHLTRTSGFQLLYAYVAALASLLTGYTRSFPIVMTWFSAAALLSGVRLVLTRAGRLYGAAIASAGVALAIAAPRAFLQITSGLEWGLAVFMTAALLAALLRHDSRPRTLAAVAAAALCLALTRADLSIFVAVFTLSIAWSRWREGVISLRGAMALCAAAAGAVLVAFAVTALNSRTITGRWIPNSIAMKEFWSRTNEFQPAIDWNMILSCTGPGTVLTSAINGFGVPSRYPMALFALVVLLVCRSEWRKGGDRRALAIASAVTVAAYTAAYARGVNLVFDHYSAGIMVPMALMTCGFLAWCGRGWQPATAALAVSIVLCAFLVKDSWPTHPAHSVIGRHAAELFGHVPAASHVAGWNVGIASWKTGGNVTNLDGLANAGVVEPIQTGTLACFLSDKNIDFLMDFGFMFPGQIDTAFSSDEELRRRLHIQRNGYDPALLYRCTTLTATADDSTVPNSRYRLFHLNSGCVTALCPRVVR
jgi:hypothetical protein